MNLQRSTAVPVLLVLAATVVGGYLRFLNLGQPPFWIDEVLFVNWLNSGVSQEYLPVWIGMLFRLQGEFWVRFPFALAGTLTIPAVYFVVKRKMYAAAAAWFISVFPLFVFWSRLARPYAMAGLFVVLGWRWTAGYIGALLCTPASLIGVNLIAARKRIIPYVLLSVAGAMTLFLRPDVHGPGVFVDFNFFFTARRLWYVPCLALVLYLFDWLVPLAVARYSRKAKR